MLILDDDHADVLVDVLEEREPEILPQIGPNRASLIEHRRWTARAYGTKLASVIRDLDWAAKPYDFTLAIVSALTHKECVYVAIACAEAVLDLAPAGDDRPRIAIETAKRWLQGKATFEECVNASEDAYYAAADAADGSARAVAAASYAAHAAADASFAAAHAAASNADAAHAADAAAHAAADASNAAGADAIKPVVLCAAIEAVKIFLLVGKGR
jgi:hypothetical protein